jgi:hypothetical protein
MRFLRKQPTPPAEVRSSPSHWWTVEHRGSHAMPDKSNPISRQNRCTRAWCVRFDKRQLYWPFGHSCYIHILLCPLLRISQAMSVVESKESGLLHSLRELIVTLASRTSGSIDHSAAASCIVLAASLALQLYDTKLSFSPSSPRASRNRCTRNPTDLCH